MQQSTKIWFTGKRFKPVCPNVEMRAFHLETGFCLVLACWKWSFCPDIPGSQSNWRTRTHYIFGKLRYCFYSKTKFNDLKWNVDIYSGPAISCISRFLLHQKIWFLSETLVSLVLWYTCIHVVYSPWLCYHAIWLCYCISNMTTMIYQRKVSCYITLDQSSTAHVKKLQKYFWHTWLLPLLLSGFERSSWRHRLPEWGRIKISPGNWPLDVGVNVHLKFYIWLILAEGHNNCSFQGLIIAI